MNEPLISVEESAHGYPVRRFVDGDAANGGGAAGREGRADRFSPRDLAQHAWFRTVALGHAASALTKAGLKLARRR